MAERRTCKIEKKTVFLLCLVLILMLCSFQVMASEQIDTDADVSMTIQYTGKKGPIKGASFLVYHVADVAETGEYVVKDAFKEYPIAFDELSQEDWQQLAVTLKGYVRRDRISEIDSGKTDNDGALVFPSKGVTMKPGLYLVVGQTREIGRYTYYASPFLICLPGMDASGVQNDYQVSVAPKSRYDYDAPDEPEYSGLTRKVLKVWNDAGNEQMRPDHIMVQLLRDNDVYDTVMLSKSNSWRYTWTGLSKGYDWSVVEKEISDYTVKVVQEGITFVMTNTYKPEEKEPEPDPSEPETLYNPGPDDPTPPDGLTPEELEEWKRRNGVLDGYDRFGNKLPQTGQLWWPVPILVCVGLFFIVVGIIRRRYAYEEE